MDERPAAGTEARHLRYSLVVDGRLDANWAGWFDCIDFQSEGDRTVLRVDVLDQAQLHAVLRQVHDLHLRLVSVTREVTPGTKPSTGETR